MMARKILYVGQLWEGSTCGERMKVFGSLGVEIIPFDTTKYVKSGSRLESSIAHRLNFGPPVWRLNRDLRAFVRTLNDEITHVWIDKGKWVTPETLKAIRRFTHATLVHYTPDPQILYHRSRYFNASISIYDLAITTKSFEVDRYKSLGARRVVRTIQGYDNRFFPRQPTSEQLIRFGSDVSFIGHYEPHYARILERIAALGVKLRIWGPGWTRYARANHWAISCVGGEGIWGEEYPVALCCAKIGLGLLSKIIPDTATTRSFEIPASGTLLLAERTVEHESLFEDGLEAEFFACDRELEEKVLKHLADPEARRKIAYAGRERCISSGYSSVAVLKKLIERVDWMGVDDARR